MVCLSLTIHLRWLGAVVPTAVDEPRGPGHEEARSEQHHTTASAPGWDGRNPACPPRALRHGRRAVNSGQPWHLPYRLWLTIRLGPVPPSPADSASQARGSSSPWSALGPHGIRNRWSSAVTGGQRRRISIAGERPFTVATLDSEAARRWVRIPCRCGHLHRPVPIRPGARRRAAGRDRRLPGPVPRPRVADLPGRAAHRPGGRASTKVVFRFACDKKLRAAVMDFAGELPPRHPLDRLYQQA
jgi:hypothetical protein